MTEAVLSFDSQREGKLRSGVPLISRSETISLSIQSSFLGPSASECGSVEPRPCPRRTAPPDPSHSGPEAAVPGIGLGTRSVPISNRPGTVMSQSPFRMSYVIGACLGGSCFAMSPVSAAGQPPAWPENTAPQSLHLLSTRSRIKIDADSPPTVKDVARNAQVENDVQSVEPNIAIISRFNARAMRRLRHTGTLVGTLAKLHGHAAVQLHASITSPRMRHCCCVAMIHPQAFVTYM